MQARADYHPVSRWLTAVAACGMVAACTGTIGEPPQGPPDRNQQPDGVVDLPDGPDDRVERGTELVMPVPVMQVLTANEYRNSIRDLLGDDIIVNTDLPPDTTKNGFTAIGATSITVSNRAVEQYENAAFDVAEQVVADTRRREALTGCLPDDTVDNACAQQFVETFGRRAFRRPLDDEEVLRYTNIADNGAELFGDFWIGIQYSLAGLLQSPFFIYRVAYGEPDDRQAGRRKLTDYEIATRLSFTLLGTTPSDALLDLAEQGRLGTAEEVAAEAERMINSRAAREHLKDFWIELFSLQRLDEVAKNTDVYPLWTDTTPESMRTETVLTVDTVVFDERRDFRDVFITENTWLNAELANIYGVDGPEGEAFELVTLPTTARRRGILGHGSVMTANSHPVSTSPTLRGKYIREAILCQDIPAPPDDVETELPEPDPDTGPTTLRQQLEAYAGVQPCGSCHGAMDPLGFGMERFDAIGGLRDNDNGLPIDSSGQIDGVPFDNLVQLTSAVRDHPALPPCVVRKTFRHVVGQPEGRGQEPILHTLEEDWARTGYRFEFLVIDMVASDGFRYTTDDIDWEGMQ